MDRPQIHTLWTAGWDSTYRVLDASIAKGMVVQPHYVIDRKRPSHAIEVLQMCVITQKVREEFPSARLLHFMLTENSDIPPNAESSDAFVELRKSAYLGDQYDWLARYAREKNLPNLELCIHKDDRAHSFVQAATSVDGWSAAHGAVFGHFSFPLLDMTKPEMAEQARRAGFDHLMHETWFCHTPTRDGSPCGMCNPCVATAQEGLAHRLPKKALRRTRSKFRPLLRRLQRFM